MRSMGVIIDTSIWVDIERGRLAPIDVAALTGDDPIYSAPPIIAELEYGVNRASTPTQKLKRASAVARIKKKPCLLIDKETGEIFGKLSAHLDSSGKPSTYRTHDLWIAALAIQHRMKILTQNRNDFKDVPGIELLILPNPK